jgi:hypothetical protein
MNMDLFFKRVYTVAFRLTGDEKNAEDMTVLAIIKISKELNGDFTATENTFQLTVLELVKIFLNTSIPYYNKNKGIQNALLKLKPINRVIVIWKDVLGYNLKDNIPIVDYTYEELYRELNCGRKYLKDNFSPENIVDIRKYAVN